MIASLKANRIENNRGACELADFNFTIGVIRFRREPSAEIAINKVHPFPMQKAMGWKASLIIATTKVEPNLVSNADHDPEFADRLAIFLPGRFTYARRSTFEQGAYPQNGNLYIGAFDGSVVIGHLDLISTCFSCDVPPVIEAINKFMPQARILALGLHSVVNFYGYALYENKKLIRGRAGSADDGVFFDFGEPIAEEIPLFAKSVTNRHGEQVWPEVFQGVMEEMDHSCMGEEFVFEISRSYFGARFDHFDHDSLPMSEYIPKPKSLFHRVMGM